MTPPNQPYTFFPIHVTPRQLPTMDTPCWEWEKHKDQKGYGIIKMKGNNEYVHRIFYRLFVGDIANMQVVMHRCDNPPCCNPSHLFKGTPADNIAHCRAKQRHAFGKFKPNSKLVEADIVAMRKGICSGYD